MPTYTVTTANLDLSQSQREKMAEAITAAHQSATRAPGYFAQVIFNALEPGRHFIGGKTNPAPQLFVHGWIRAGRSKDQKQALMSEIVEKAQPIVNIGAENIWVYIQDIDASQMIEFGRFLPEPGGEAEWQKGISPARLADFKRAGILPE